MKIPRPLVGVLVVLVLYGSSCYKAWNKRPGLSTPIGFPPAEEAVLKDWIKTQKVFGVRDFDLVGFLKAPFGSRPQAVKAHSVDGTGYRGLYVTHPSKPTIAVEFPWSNGSYQAPREVSLAEIQAKEFEAIKPKIDPNPLGLPQEK
jgi:hypothetical protein